MIEDAIKMLLDNEGIIPEENANKYKLKFEYEDVPMSFVVQ